MHLSSTDALTVVDEVVGADVVTVTRPPSVSWFTVVTVGTPVVNVVGATVVGRSVLAEVIGLVGSSVVVVAALVVVVAALVVVVAALVVVVAGLVVVVAGFVVVVAGFVVVVAGSVVVAGLVVVVAGLVVVVAASAVVIVVGTVVVDAPTHSSMALAFRTPPKPPEFTALVQHSISLTAQL
ncbi:MAG: uncharacterized protein KVP18_001229 [Porospora cf. gigantea A]|uniref:uncharacterized protein n=1 Tax=Porospora cf. gigantea A TaxID=2853593 RepID=UPI00355990A7|nr:MAG: hypothetical protein KVP18_001229 [Porospora cf. gigantea A]